MEKKQFARPREILKFSCGTSPATYITCYPEGKWQIVSSAGSFVELTNKNVTININHVEFENNWIKLGRTKRKGE